MAGHTEVTVPLCILKTAGDRASGGGESIYSTVIEKGRLMCTYKGHRGWVGVVKEEGAFELLPQISLEQSTKLEGSSGVVECPASVFDSSIQESSRAAISGQ